MPQFSHRPDGTGFFLPGPVIPGPAHKGVDVRLLVPREAYILHLAVHAGVRPPTAAEEGTNPPTEQAADCTTEKRTDAGHHGTDGRTEPAANPRACTNVWLVGEKQAARKGTKAETSTGRAERAEKRGTSYPPPPCNTIRQCIKLSLSCRRRKKTTRHI